MPEYFDIRIELGRVDRPPWRRFLISRAATFHDLHEAIQDATGWEDAHLFAFYDKHPFRDVIAGVPDEYSDDDIPDAWTTPLSERFKRRGSRCGYLYDYGDEWHVSVRCEGIVELDDGFPRRLREGEKAFPPEDCGGMGGYERCLEFARTGNDPWGEDEDLSEWLGDWQPDGFDLAAAKEAFDAGGRGRGITEDEDDFDTGMDEGLARARETLSRLQDSPLDGPFELDRKWQRMDRDVLCDALAHPDPLVRDVVLVNLTRATPKVPGAMGKAISAIEAHGWHDAFALPFQIAALEQDAESLSWLLHELEKTDGELASMPARWRGAFLQAFANADVDHLRPLIVKLRKSDALDVGVFLDEPVSRIYRRIQLADTAPAECWRLVELECEADEECDELALEDFAEGAARGGEPISQRVLAQLRRMPDAGRRPVFERLSARPRSRTHGRVDATRGGRTVSGRAPSPAGRRIRQRLHAFASRDRDRPRRRIGVPGVRA
jgi:hypothetical protein